MRSRSSLFAFSIPLLATLALIAGLATAQDAATTPQQLASSLHGDAIRISRASHSGTDVRAGRASTVLDMTPDAVWAVVTDYARYHEFLPHFTQSRVLSKRGTTAIVYVEAQLLAGAATVWAEIRVQEGTPIGSTRVITSRTTRTNTRRLDARWEVTPVEGGPRTRSLVTFEVLVEPDLPFPAGMMSDENESAARDSIRNLRQHVASLRP